MGRNHPFGIILAAILFGILYQGGDAVSFDMPEINRNMILMIQGLVILFVGALEFMLRPTSCASIIVRQSVRPDYDVYDTLISILGSTIRLRYR